MGMRFGNEDYWVDSAVRAIKTFAQTMVGLIGTEAASIIEVGWLDMLAVSGTATVVSALMSIVNAPSGSTPVGE